MNKVLFYSFLYSIKLPKWSTNVHAKRTSDIILQSVNKLRDFSCSMFDFRCSGASFYNLSLLRFKTIIFINTAIGMKNAFCPLLVFEVFKSSSFRARSNHCAHQAILQTIYLTALSKRETITVFYDSCVL